MTDLGSQIRIMRAVRNISQRELAEAADLPNTYISQAERGKWNLEPDEIERIKEALQWPSDAAVQRACDTLAGEKVEEIT